MTSNRREASTRDAVHRVQGYPVREVSQHLRVNSHALCTGMTLFAESAPKSSGLDLTAKSRQRKRGLARATKDRDIVSMPTLLENGSVTGLPSRAGMAKSGVRRV